MPPGRWGALSACQRGVIVIDLQGAMGAMAGPMMGAVMMSVMG